MFEKKPRSGNASWMGTGGYTPDLRVLIEVTAGLHKAETLTECADLALAGSCRIASADDGCLHLRNGKFRLPHNSLSFGVHTSRPPISYFGEDLEPVLLGKDEIQGADGEISMLLVPVVGRENQLHGALELVRRKRDAFSVKQICTLKNLTVSLAIALENIEINKPTMRMLAEPRAEDSMENLRAALNRAERASQAKSQYLALISHEIRNPLGVILGLSEVALENPELGADTRQLLDGIHRNGQQLSKIVGKVLDLAKIEAGAFEVEMTEIELFEFLNGVAHDFEISVRAKNRLRFDLEIASDVPRLVKSDPTRLRQILINLLQNALKFTEDGSICMAVRVEKNQIAISVRDTGIGISREHRERLFQSYAQADNSIVRRFGGTGLGLAISRKMARALGGELRLGDSEPGRGSEFVLELPLVESL